MVVVNLSERYGKVYKVRDDGTEDSCRENRIWCQEIRGKYGVIYPFSNVGQLAVRVVSKTRIKNSLVAARLIKEGYKCVQQGDWEQVFVFEQAKFTSVATLIQAKKRKRLSPENKAKAIAALAKARRVSKK